MQQDKHTSRPGPLHPPPMLAPIAPTQPSAPACAASPCTTCLPSLQAGTTITGMQHWVLTLTPGQTLLHPSSHGPLWRIARGWVALHQSVPESSGPLLTQLAGPGDLVGLAALQNTAYGESALALTPTQASPAEWQSPAQKIQLLQDLVQQQQRQAQDMARLRTGPIAARLRYLLALLSPSHPTQPDRRTLPQLRDLALIVDAAPATVCRELGRILPPEAAAPAPVKPTHNAVHPNTSAPPAPNGCGVPGCTPTVTQAAARPRRHRSAAR